MILPLVGSTSKGWRPSIYWHLATTVIGLWLLTMSQPKTRWWLVTTFISLMLYSHILFLFQQNQPKSECTPTRALTNPKKLNLNKKKLESYFVLNFVSFLTIFGKRCCSYNIDLGLWSILKWWLAVGKSDFNATKFIQLDLDFRVLFMFYGLLKKVKSFFGIGQ